jgi:DNA invertase Pin-like site-specific DNA recombinase
MTRDPKTMDGYIRVSRRMGRKGKGYISPKVQREAIKRWAEYRGVEILAWHEDEDESGGTHSRPGLDAARDRALNGETGGIVSWKIDRFSRFTEGGLRDLRLLEDAGARLAFVVEDIDTSGPMGKLVYTMLLAFAEFFLDNIKAGWVATKTRAVERGAHIGPTPIGYQRREDGTLEVDVDLGPVVTEAFAVAAASGLQRTNGFLRAHAPRRTWTAFTTRRFLACRTYLGRVDYGELVCENAHAPLVTRATFEAANHAIGDVGENKRRPAGDFPLSGVASCGSCNGRMVGARGGADNRRMYRCADRSCDARATVTAANLEAHVVATLREAFKHPGFEVGTPSPDTDAAVEALEDAERELEAFGSDLTARKRFGHRYHHFLEQRAAAVEAAQEELREALASAEPPRKVVPDELWDTLEPAELAEVLRAGLDTVVVSRGGRGRRPIGERVRVVPKGLDRGALAGAQDA